MYKNEFQGCNFNEIFNPSIKDPLSNFRIIGTNGIQKILDKDLKETIFQLEGTSTKLSIPKETKNGLSLIQRYIVFQVNIKENIDFSLEIGISDLSQNKRNLHFSTAVHSLAVQPLSAKIPMKINNRLQWTNLIFDLTTLINDIWKNQTLKSIESFSIFANCKLRKIFTINKLPIPNEMFYDDPTGPIVDFPKIADSITHIFNLNDGKIDLSMNYNKNINEQKSKNVFKIAFGTKMLTNEHRKKTLKPLPQIEPQTEIVEIDKILPNSNLISPVSIQSAALPLRRKSESDNQQSEADKAPNSKKQQPGDTVQVSKITSWNQRAVKSSNIDSLPNSISSEQSNTSRLINTSFGINSDVQSNKIPHPPPQSTRPTNSSARKLRLSSAVKSNKPASSKQNKLINYCGESSSNEEDIHNNSSKTLIEYSPFKNKIPKSNSSTSSGIGTESLSDLVQAMKLKSVPKKTRQMQLISNQSNEDSSKNSSSVYSFSSRPKPAGLNQRKDPLNDSNNSNKVYDFRKYSANNIKSIQNNSISFNDTNDSNILQNKTQPFKNSTNKQTESIELKENIVTQSNQLFDSIDNKKTIITYDNNYNHNEPCNEVLDSFEAKMLRDMKAEMESNTKIKEEPTKKQQFLKPESFNVNPKSPDAEYFEIIQHEASGFQSPFSDDNNQTTSEKYNFDAITSSIDDTTTSLSKKTPNRRANNENNYQEEMDVSLQLNLPSKSINLKDFQLNYSPLQNQAHHNYSALQRNPISEEPSHYDDSQADIDDLVSDSEEEVDLLYDPSLNCYYDPKTSTYYELNLS